MGKGYIVAANLVLSPCNCNYIHTVAARQGSLQIRKLYQIKTIDTTQPKNFITYQCLFYCLWSHADRK